MYLTKNGRHIINSLLPNFSILMFWYCLHHLRLHLWVIECGLEEIFSLSQNIPQWFCILTYILWNLISFPYCRPVSYPGVGTGWDCILQPKHSQLILCCNWNLLAHPSILKLIFNKKKDKHIISFLLIKLPNCICLLPIILLFWLIENGLRETLSHSPNIPTDFVSLLSYFASKSSHERTLSIWLVILVMCCDWNLLVHPSILNCESS